LIAVDRKELDAVYPAICGQ